MFQSSWATGRTLIHVAGKLIMIVNNEQVVFNMFKAMEYPESSDDYFVVNNIIENAVTKVQERSQPPNPLERALVTDDRIEDEELVELMVWLDNLTSSSEHCNQVEPLPV